MAIAAPVVLAHHREVLRPLARGLALGAGVCLAIVAVPLWWQFAGPRSYTSIWHPPGGNDLAQLSGRATRSIGADVWASAALSMNRTEENSFFGIPLLLAAVAVVIALWRRPAVQALGVVGRHRVGGPRCTLRHAGRERDHCPKRVLVRTLRPVLG